MDKKRLLKQAIIIYLMFGFKYLPPLGQMTELGMAIFGIFVGAIFGWITLDMAFPSIAGIIALGFSGAYPSFVAMFQSTFANDTTVMMMGCMLVCAFIEVMNLPDIIIGYLMNLKLAKKNIIGFFIVFFMTTWVVSAFSNGVLSAYLMVVMYRGMVKKANIDPFTVTNSFVLCGIGLFSVFGNIALPFRETSILILATLNSLLPEPFPFGSYFLYCTSFEIFLIILYVLIGRFVLRVDFSKFISVDVPKIIPNKQQKAGLWCTFFMMIAFILTATKLPVFPKLGLGGVAILIVLFMLLVQVNGKPLLNLQEIAAKFSWSLYLLIAFFMGIASFLTKAEVGITATCQDLCAPLLASVSSGTFIILALIFSTILTNFLNNMPVAVIFISTMFAIGDSLTGINMTAACLAIVMASFCAGATPAANPITATMFANTDLIKTSIQLKVGIISCGLMCLVCIVIYYPLLSILL